MSIVETRPQSAQNLLLDCPNNMASILIMDTYLDTSQCTRGLKVNKLGARHAYWLNTLEANNIRLTLCISSGSIL